MTFSESQKPSFSPTITRSTSLEDFSKTATATPSKRDSATATRKLPQTETASGSGKKSQSNSGEDSETVTAEKSYSKPRPESLTTSMTMSLESSDSLSRRTQSAPVSNSKTKLFSSEKSAPETHSRSGSSVISDSKSIFRSPSISLPPTRTTSHAQNQNSTEPNTTLIPPTPTPAPNPPEPSRSGYWGLLGLVAVPTLAAIPPLVSLHRRNTAILQDPDSGLFRDFDDNNRIFPDRVDDPLVIADQKTLTARLSALVSGLDEDLKKEKADLQSEKGEAEKAWRKKLQAIEEKKRTLADSQQPSPLPTAEDQYPLSMHKPAGYNASRRSSTRRNSRNPEEQRMEVLALEKQSAEIDSEKKFYAEKLRKINAKFSERESKIKRLRDVSEGFRNSDGTITNPLNQTRGIESFIKKINEAIALHSVTRNTPSEQVTLQKEIVILLRKMKASALRELSKSSYASAPYSLEENFERTASVGTKTVKTLTKKLGILDRFKPSLQRQVYESMDGVGAVFYGLVNDLALIQKNFLEPEDEAEPYKFTVGGIPFDGMERKFKFSVANEEFRITRNELFGLSLEKKGRLGWYDYRPDERDVEALAKLVMERETSSVSTAAQRYLHPQDTAAVDVQSSRSVSNNNSPSNDNSSNATASDQTSLSQESLPSHTESTESYSEKIMRHAAVAAVVRARISNLKIEVNENNPTEFFGFRWTQESAHGFNPLGKTSSQHHPKHYFKSRIPDQPGEVRGGGATIVKKQREIFEELVNSAETPTTPEESRRQLLGLIVKVMADKPLPQELANVISVAPYSQKHVGFLVGSAPSRGEKDMRIFIGVEKECGLFLYRDASMKVDITSRDISEEERKLVSSLMSEVKKMEKVAEEGREKQSKVVRKVASKAALSDTTKPLGQGPTQTAPFSKRLGSFADTKNIQSKMESDEIESSEPRPDSADQSSLPPLPPLPPIPSTQESEETSHDPHSVGEDEQKSFAASSGREGLNPIPARKEEKHLSNNTSSPDTSSSEDETENGSECQSLIELEKRLAESTVTDALNAAFRAQTEAPSATPKPSEISSRRKPEERGRGVKDGGNSKTNS